MAVDPQVDNDEERTNTKIICKRIVLAKELLIEKLLGSIQMRIIHGAP
jgi:hypothetical protein